MAVVPFGRRDKDLHWPDDLNWLDPELPTGNPGYRRNVHTRDRSGAEIPTSRLCRLAQSIVAAEESRKENKMQEGGRNSRRPWDFEARGPLRAIG